MPREKKMDPKGVERCSVSDLARPRSPRGSTATRVRPPVINVSPHIHTYAGTAAGGTSGIHRRCTMRVEQTPVRYTVNISVPALEADGREGAEQKRRWGLKAEWVNERASLRAPAARARATSVCR